MGVREITLFIFVCLNAILIIENTAVSIYHGKFLFLFIFKYIPIKKILVNICI